MELSQGLLIHLPIAFKKTNAANGTTYDSGWINVRGQARIEGNIRSDKIPDAGFPELSFSTDGVNADRVIVIPQDAGAGVADFVYRIDYRIQQRYVRLRFKQTTGAAGTFRWEAYARPDSGGNPQ